MWARAVISPCLVKRVERVAGRSATCVGEFLPGDKDCPYGGATGRLPVYSGPPCASPLPHRTDCALKAARASKGEVHASGAPAHAVTTVHMQWAAGICYHQVV